MECGDLSPLFLLREESADKSAHSKKNDCCPAYARGTPAYGVRRLVAAFYCERKALTSQRTPKKTTVVLRTREARLLMECGDLSPLFLLREESADKSAHSKKNDCCPAYARGAPAYGVRRLVAAFYCARKALTSQRTPKKATVVLRTCEARLPMECGDLSPLFLLREESADKSAHSKKNDCCPAYARGAPAYGVRRLVAAFY